MHGGRVFNVYILWIPADCELFSKEISAAKPVLRMTQQMEKDNRERECSLDSDAASLCQNNVPEASYFLISVVLNFTIATSQNRI